VVIGKESKISELLKFYMGKNTPDRQEFIINNLKIEIDTLDEQEELVAS
jgi:topoisomerase-4 subunit B